MEQEGVCGTDDVCWVYLWPPPATPSHAVPATPAFTKDGRTAGIIWDVGDSVSGQEGNDRELSFLP